MRGVRELRLGRGTLAPALGELGRYLLVVAEPLREPVLRAAAAQPAQVVVASTLERAELDELFASAEPVDWVAGVGGGVAIDIAKYGAGLLATPYLAAPTILSTTAYVNPLAVLREGTSSVMVPTLSPERLVVDIEILEQAPCALNVAGLGDVLSCHTALRDWRLAVDDGASSHPWDDRAALQSRLLVDSVAAHADDLRAMNERALKLLVDLHIEVVDICGELGHARPEAGSEHLLVEAIEEITGRSFLHGPIVGLGVDVMAELQENDHGRIVQIMHEIGLPYSPLANGVSRAELVDALTLLARPEPPRRWRSILDHVDLSPERIASLVDSRAFA